MSIPIPVRCVIRTEKKKNPETVAVLVDIPGTNDPTTFQVFSPTDGHVTGTYGWFANKTKPANATEVGRLLTLLRKAGYHPVTSLKIPRDAFLKRLAAINQPKP